MVSDTSPYLISALPHSLPRGAVRRSQALLYSERNIPQLPSQSTETGYWNRQGWTGRFTGFLCRLQAPCTDDTAAVYVAYRPKAGSQAAVREDSTESDLMVATSTTRASYISPETWTFKAQLFEVAYTPPNGNCFFAAIASVVYGDYQFWPHVKAQHRSWLELVLANPQHPRNSCYKKWANDVSDEMRNRERLHAVAQFQSATIAQLSADLYGLTFAILESVLEEEMGTHEYEGYDAAYEGNQNRPMLDNGQRILKVGSLYGHRSDPVRFIFFNGIHFEAARPRIDLPAQPSDYELPEVLYSATRPWKEFGNGEMPRLNPAPCIAHPSTAEIQTAARGCLKDSVFITLRDSRDSTPERKEPELITLRDSRDSTPEGKQPVLITLRDSRDSTPEGKQLIPIPGPVPPVPAIVAGFAPDKLHAITAWRSRGGKPPDQFWQLSCSYEARREDLRRDARELEQLKLLENFSPSDHVMVGKIVSELETLELRCLDANLDEDSMQAMLQTLLRRLMNRNNNVTNDFNGFQAAIRYRVSRITGLQMGQQGFVYERALTRLGANFKRPHTKRDFVLKLGLYLYARYHVHQKCRHPNDATLDIALSHMRENVRV